MSNKLYSDIQAQAENMAHVVERIYGVGREQIASAVAALDPNRPTVFIGVASAEYLCMPAAHYLNTRGIPARVLCASDALYSHWPSLRRSNIIINSRSGETAEIVRLCQLLVEQGILFQLITNEPDSTAARLAHRVVWVDTRKDELVSINVVTGMMAGTLAICTALTGEQDAVRPAFAALPAMLGEMVGQASARSGEFHNLLAGIRPLYLIYRGASIGAAYCGRLVMEEVARQPGVAIGAAEFRQGPNEVIDERFGALLFIPPGKEGELNLHLAADIQRSGGRVLLIGEIPGNVSGQPGEVIFTIPSAADFIRPVLEVVPAQLLAYELARSQGYEPGEVRYISKVILTEEGIPNQS